MDGTPFRAPPSAMLDDRAANLNDGGPAQSPRPSTRHSSYEELVV